MVHQFTFKLHFRHTLNDLYKNKVVGKYKSEELAFGLQIIFFVLDQLLPALLRSFPFNLFFAFSDKSVMCLFQVCRTNIFWAVGIFPEMSEQSYKVTPHGGICNMIAVSDTDFYGVPIFM